MKRLTAALRAIGVNDDLAGWLRRRHVRDGRIVTAIGAGLGVHRSVILAALGDLGIADRRHPSGRRIAVRRDGD